MTTPDDSPSAGRWRKAALVVGALAFLFLAFNRTLRPGGEARDEAGEVIRLVHTQLEPGVREAFDALARRYEELHPGVRVEQIAVPARLYPMWIETKLNAGLAPDLVQLYGVDDEKVLRHFTPLGAVVDEVNPYNAGSALAGQRWRDTFFDGLTTAPAYSSNLMNHFGIPFTIFTFRMFYNRDLLREITGADQPPTTAVEWWALGRQAAEFSQRTGRKIYPLAGSRLSGEGYTLAGSMFDGFLAQMVGSQTQRLAPTLEPTHELEVWNADFQVSFIKGQWSLRSPEIRSGLEMLREIAALCQPGFMQSMREDAMFQFQQGRALMIPSGSFDLPSARMHSTFPVGVFRLPTPAPGDPRYGRGVVGPVSESAAGGQLVLGVSQRSAHRERAIDFLRFATSHEGASGFSRRSGWLPALLQVEPPEELRVFMPEPAGYRSGFTLMLGSESSRVYRNHLHRLISPQVDLDAALGDMENSYRTAVIADLSAATKNITRNAALYDTVIGSLAEQSGLAAEAATARDRRMSEISESQTFQEEASYWRRRELALYADNPKNLVPTSPPSPDES